MAPPIKKNKEFSSDNRRLISSTEISEHEQQQQLGSLVTALGKRRSVRMAKKMNRRFGTNLKRWVCNDLWMDIFPFFGRSQLGLKLALLSPRFNALVDKHFDGKSELTLWRSIAICKGYRMPKISVQNDFVEFPLPDRPLPNKIRFRDLQINFRLTPRKYWHWPMAKETEHWTPKKYINHSVIAFFRSNQHILNKGINLCLNYLIGQSIWDVFVREFWPLFAPNIRGLGLFGGPHLDNLLRLISPTILTDLDQLNSIHSDCPFYADGIGFGNANPPNVAGQALSKWLHTPTKDGQLKQFHCNVHYAVASAIEKWLNNFKEAFLCATTTCARHILSLVLPTSAQIVPFELVNEGTREKLSMEKGVGHFWSGRHWVVKRCPIGETVQWEDENWNNLNNIVITLFEANNCMGRLSPRKARQKKGPAGRKQ